jgi:uncharacterized protein GlcG (DUF336 family)
MREPLSYDVARRVAEAALEAGRAEDAQVCATVVNRSGIAKVMLSDDGVGKIAVETARLKAYTAAVMGIPTAMLATVLEENPVMRLTPPHVIDNQLLPVPGGYPISTDDGEVIGAIGVAGAPGDTDDRIAKEALKGVAALLT